ncbi:MAG: hypothetical protein K9J17_02895 [Flavobacteriales bacterium]|nr:hypothetical protein [Flavobacteriales bacterium]
MNFISSLLLAFSITFFAVNPKPDTKKVDQMSYTDCLEKYRSSWGEECSQCTAWKDSYVVYLKNTCDESIDVMICVQEDNKQWKRFHHTSMAPGDSLRAYACVGTGKYLSWGRRAGDESVVFPSIEQVNQEYNK